MARFLRKCVTSIPNQSYRSEKCHIPLFPRKLVTSKLLFTFPRTLVTSFLLFAFCPSSPKAHNCLCPLIINDYHLFVFSKLPLWVLPSSHLMQFPFCLFPIMVSLVPKKRCHFHSINWSPFFPSHHWLPFLSFLHLWLSTLHHFHLYFTSPPLMKTCISKTSPFHFEFSQQVLFW